MENQTQVPQLCLRVDQQEVLGQSTEVVGCTGEEDFIGKDCKVAKGAVHPTTLARRVLERCMLGLNIHLMSLKAKSKKAVDVD